MPDPLREITSSLRQLRESAQAYQGPVTMSGVLDAVGRLEALDQQAVALYGKPIEFILGSLHAFSEQAPRYGAAGVLYPVLQGVLDSAMRPVPALLVLVPAHAVREPFDALPGYWQPFEEIGGGGVPYEWSSTAPRMVPRDQAHPLRGIPIPCPVHFPSARQDDPFLWAAAFHEIGHHLYDSFSTFTSVGENQAIVDLKADSQRLSTVLQAAACCPNEKDLVALMDRHMAELFSDLFAAKVLGVAYLPVLARYVEDDRRGSVHRALRLRVVRRALGDEVQHFAGVIGERAGREGVEPREVLEEPAGVGLKATWLPWEKYADRAAAFVNDLARDRVKDGHWPRMRADLAETNELVDLLLNYVAPAGAVALAEPDESDGPAPLVTNVTLGPARIGSILAAGYLVRWCPALWKRFRAPWRARREEDASADCLASAERAQRDAQSALYRLVLKGLDISRIEDAVNGTDRVRAG